MRRLPSIFATAVTFLTVIVLTSARTAAAPEPPVEPKGVYFFKNPSGIWITTFSAAGKGRSEVKLIIDGVVHDDRYEFKWSMKDREIIRVRLTDPELKIVEHELLLPDGRIRPLKSYRDGKLLWEAPKDTGTMEFIGKEAAP